MNSMLGLCLTALLIEWTDVFNRSIQSNYLLLQRKDTCCAVNPEFLRATPAKFTVQLVLKGRVKGGICDANISG